MKKALDSQLYYSYHTVEKRIIRLIQLGGTDNSMLTFDDFKTDGRLPVYQQILDYIKRGAIAGTVADGDELPSRRVLSARLGINPNTVQKAFALLEEEGLIESRAGSGSVMKLTQERVAELRSELLEDELRGMARVLKQTGLGKDEAAELIKKYWEEDE